MDDSPQGIPNTNSGAKDKPGFLGLVSFAAPMTAAYFLANPIWSVLPGVYAKYFDLELTTIAAVILLSRMFDGFTDPMVGYLSDRHRVAGGERKSWVLVGGILVLIASYFLFVPPDVISRYYLLFSLFGFFLALTVYEIPCSAWGVELASDYTERARVFGYRTTFFYIGQISFFLFPFLPIFATSEYTPETLNAAFYFGAVLMLISLCIMYLAAPAGYSIKTKNRETLRSLIETVVQNKPLLLFMLFFSFAGTGFGMWTGLLFIYLDSYLDLGESIATIFLLGNVAALCSIPLWLRLVHKTNKAQSFAFGLLLFMLCLAGCLFLKPGVAWPVALLFAGGPFIAASGLTVLYPSMLGDIADYGIFKFKENRTATYFALFTLFYKITLGLGSGISLGMVGYFGYDATTTAQSQSAVLGLYLGFMIIPLIFLSIALILVLFSPISKQRHHAIRRRIASRSICLDGEVCQ
ncbi:MFS transporter [SAR92 clade bacterium H231]|nr:MFS transporter [SAR92 clade bacterium H231]